MGHAPTGRSLILLAEILDEVAMTDEVCVPTLHRCRARASRCAPPLAHRRGGAQPGPRKSRPALRTQWLSRGHVATVDQLVEVIDQKIVDLRSGLELQHADACEKTGVLPAVGASEVGSVGQIVSNTASVKRRLFDTRPRDP